MVKSILYPLKFKNREFANAENPIFDSEKTAFISNSGLVFSESNLELSALANSRFLNLSGYTYEGRGVALILPPRWLAVTRETAL